MFFMLVAKSLVFEYASGNELFYLICPVVEADLTAIMLCRCRYNHAEY
jgi:hypothetical protein